MATTGGVEPPFTESESGVLPLDDVAMKMAEVRGIEPLFAGSKPAVLPLNDTPSLAPMAGFEPALTE